MTQTYNIPYRFANLEEALKVPVDGIIVLTPYKTTFPTVKAILERRFPVLSEKPMASMLEQAQELINLAKEQSTLYMVALNRRFAEPYQYVKGLMEGRRTECITVEKVKDMTYYHDQPLLDFGIHALDLLLWLAGGKVTNLQMDYASMEDGRESTVSAQFRFDNGILGRFFMSCAAGM